MKRFSAQYTITNSGQILKRAVITVDDNGRIIDILDTGGQLTETHSVEFFNGIIIPGFVNCHCHLELSGMKGIITSGEGMGTFIEKIRSKRDSFSETISASASRADMDMFNDGISLCADICNTEETFSIKNKSRISYLNLIEVFGIDPEKAGKRMDEVLRISEKSREMGLPWFLVPHSGYSVSLSLFRLLAKECKDNKISSFHFMETAGEKQFLDNHSGPLVESYRRSGLLPHRFETVKNHTEAVLNEITSSGNLILVHNTFADQDTIRMIQKRENLFWCLCPESNLYIENKLPPVDLLLREGCEIVIGTDSLASNNKLSILEELITLQLNFPWLSLEDLITWATLNGAKALCEEDNFGKIEVGKKPGLLLLQNVDLQKMKLLKESSVLRLI